MAQLLKISEQTYDDRNFIFNLKNIELSESVDELLVNISNSFDNDEDFKIIVKELERVTDFVLPESSYGWIMSFCDIEIF